MGFFVTLSIWRGCSIIYEILVNFHENLHEDEQSIKEQF